MVRIIGLLLLVLITLATGVFPASDYAVASEPGTSTKAPPSQQADTESEYPPEYPILNSDIIVYGTITGEKTEVVTVGEGERVGKNVYTMLTLTVEKTIKGDSGNKEVLIKQWGGRTPEVTTDPGWPYLQTADKALLCLVKEEGSIYKVQSKGLLWIDSKYAKTIDITFQEVICRTTEIMRKNNIPIALKPEEIPCPSPTITDRLYSVVTNWLWLIIAVLVILTGTTTALIIRRRHHKHPKIG